MTPPPGEIDPVSWLARDFGTDPAGGLAAVADAIVGATRLVATDQRAVRAALDALTQGSAWRALQLQDPLNITILGQLTDAARAAGPATDPEVVVENVVSRVRAAMFPGVHGGSGRRTGQLPLPMVEAARPARLTSAGPGR